MLGAHAADFDLNKWYQEVDELAATEGASVANPLQFWRTRLGQEMLTRELVAREPGPPATADERRQAERHARQTGGCRCHQPTCADKAEHRRRLIDG